MSTKPTQTRVEEDAAAQKLADGLAKHQATIGDLIIGAQKYAVAAAIALVLAPVQTSKDVAVKKAAYEAALEADRRAKASSKVFVYALKQTLLAMFVGQVEALADFGLKGRKPRVVSPETKVAAAARAKATRELRRTLGPVQRLAIQAPPVTVSTAVGTAQAHALEATPPPIAAPKV